MTRPHASTSTNGVSPATKTLRSLLWRFDEPGGPIWPFDEVKRWTAGVLDQLVSLGIVKEIGWTYIVACDSCVDNNILEVDIIDYPTGTVGMAKCPECGRLPVPLDRLRQWAPHFDGLARAVALAVGAAGGVTVEVPGRTAFLGSIQRGDNRRDVFLCSGLCRPDAGNIVAQTARLASAASPVVIVPSDLPTTSIDWGTARPLLLSLAEITTLKDEAMAIDPAALFAEIHPLTPAPEPTDKESVVKALPEVEMAILEAVAASPHQTMFVTDIIEAGGYSKTATRDAVASLEEQGYVGRPKGTKRKGVAVTDTGQIFLRRAMAATPNGRNP